MSNRFAGRGAAGAALVAAALLVTACAQDQPGPTTPVFRAPTVAAIYCDEQIIPEDGCEERPAPPPEGGGEENVGYTVSTTLTLPGSASARTDLTEEGFPTLSGSGTVSSSRGGRIDIALTCPTIEHYVSRLTCQQSVTLNGINCQTDQWSGSIATTHTARTLNGNKNLGTKYSNSGYQSCGSPPPPTGGRECFELTLIFVEVDPVTNKEVETKVTVRFCSSTTF